VVDGFLVREGWLAEERERAERREGEIGFARVW